MRSLMYARPPHRLMGTCQDCQPTLKSANDTTGKFKGPNFLLSLLHATSLKLDSGRDIG